MFVINDLRLFTDNVILNETKISTACFITFENAIRIININLQLQELSRVNLKIILLKKYVKGSTSFGSM